jgi:hypothetical protein
MKALALAGAVVGGAVPVAGAGIVADVAPAAAACGQNNLHQATLKFDVPQSFTRIVLLNTWEDDDCNHLNWHSIQYSSEGAGGICDRDTDWEAGGDGQSGWARREYYMINKGDGLGCQWYGTWTRVNQSAEPLNSNQAPLCWEGTNTAYQCKNID